MDWNGDGHTDGRDSSLFNMEIEKSRGSTSSNSSGGSIYGRCLHWFLIGLITFGILSWLCKVC